MLHRYPARFFAGLGLRLGLGEGVLLGSAGLALATSLLLFEAPYNGAAARVEWAGNPEPNPAAFTLSHTSSPGPAFRPPARLAPAGPRRPAAPSQPYTTAGAATVGLVQRSWDTLKATFR